MHYKYVYQLLCVHTVVYAGYDINVFEQNSRNKP